MKFRRIYWVTESVASDGSSSVTGVYTSIPDLVDQGLAPLPGLRINLVELDRGGEPIGRWQAPSFGGLAEVLDDAVKSGEFTPEQSERLLGALGVSPTSGV